MRIPKNARTVLGLLAGAGAVAAVGAVAGADAAAAKTKGGSLRVVDVNVSGLDGVYQNSVVEITFTADVDPVSVNPAVFQVRQRNATGTGFTKQVPGTFQVAGNVVRFYPRLPTHLRDPLSSTDAFYSAGTPRDDANENAGLKPSTAYQVYLIGGATPDAIRSVSGRKLARSQTARFSTTPTSPKSDAFTIETYGDAPPPGFQYSNPSDKVASPDDQYAKHGGTREVPNAISVTLFGNRVPISPSTLRQGSNASLTMTERNGDPSLTKPIRGTPFVEQNFDGTRIVFSPNFPLPDRGTYAFRLTKDVKDLTEQYDFRNNPERLRLRDIYEFMVTAQQLSPGTPPADLPDPPIELIFDWPTDPEARSYRSTYVKLLQGWGFDANAPAGAVLKGWVESRFGIAPTFHKAPLEHFPSEAWMRYLEEKLSSRFHNNCILLQLDVLFEYAQFCLERFQPFGPGTHVQLYRGAQRAEVQLLSGSIKERRGVIRLNNLVSFSLSRERAEEFGDVMLIAQVPIAKLLFYPGLVQDRVLNGEGEALVLGGDFEVDLSFA